MSRLTLELAGGIFGAAVLVAFSGCGNAPAPARPAPAPAPAPRPVAPAPVPVPAPTPEPGLAETDPVLTRLGLSADQVKKVNALAEEYAKKAEALPRDAKTEDRKALAAERTAKIRETLSTEQAPKFDAGTKTVGEYNAKVLELQQETSRAMMTTPADQLEKRREVTKTYREKRAVLDADLARKLDEQVGRQPGK